MFVNIFYDSFILNFIRMMSNIFFSNILYFPLAIFSSDSCIFSGWLWNYFAFVLNMDKYADFDSVWSVCILYNALFSLRDLLSQRIVTILNVVKNFAYHAVLQNVLFMLMYCSLVYLIKQFWSNWKYDYKERKWWLLTSCFQIVPTCRAFLDMILMMESISWNYTIAMSP